VVAFRGNGPRAGSMLLVNGLYRKLDSGEPLGKALGMPRAIIGGCKNDDHKTRSDASSSDSEAESGRKEHGGSAVSNGTPCGRVATAT
jgi:hypothetical protein